MRGWLEQASPAAFSAYCIAAAFGVYFCMYAFRKPFTAGEYADLSLGGVGYKSVLIAAQVAGYTLSKFIGVKVISEMPAARRGVAIVLLIAVAEAALLGFAVTPAPWGWLLLFVNGLPLGMVFGLVLSFLEGRRVTEALSAGLCASFIVSSGVVKSVGRSLIVDHGVSEPWMPFLTGLLFLAPLLLGVWLLTRLPPPTAEDIRQRSERRPMSRADRRSLLRRHAWGIGGMVTIYVLLTVLRSLRDDFAVEIWRGLGHDGAPSVFAASETVVMLAVVLINGSLVWFANNRAALLASLGLVLGGFFVVLASVAAWRSGAVGPFAFMVLVGTGTYVPYVAFHTTVFERLIATFREPGNLGFLMYLADAMGYLGYVGVMIAKGWFAGETGFLPVFLGAATWLSGVAVVITGGLLLYYTRTAPRLVETPLVAQAKA